MTYRIIESNRAKRNIHRISDYLLFVLQSKQATKNFLDEVEQKYDKIARNPYGYTEAPFGKYWYRKATVGKYIIAFRIDEQTHTVHIIAIGHSLQKRSNITKDRK